MDADARRALLIALAHGPAMAPADATALAGALTESGLCECSEPGRAASGPPAGSRHPDGS